MDYRYDFHCFSTITVIKGIVFTPGFWEIVEPEYSIPPGYVGELYTQGIAHQLVNVGRSSYTSADVQDSKITGYVARLAEYQTAYAAWQAGAHIENVGGQIVISGPPTLSADKAQISNDGTDTITLTCDLGDLAATDAIRWSVTAPDGSVIEEVDNAVGGAESWQLTTSHVGLHTVRVETDYFGWAEITFEGV